MEARGGPGDQKQEPRISQENNINTQRGHYERHHAYNVQKQQQQTLLQPPGGGGGDGGGGVSRSISASSISINSDAASRREKERREREKELRREIRDRFIYKSRSGNRLDATPNMGLAYSRSGDQLHMTR